MKTYSNIIPLLAGKKGIKLYSPVFGEVSLVIIDPPYIYVEDSEGLIKAFLQDGKLYEKGECVLFPSRSVRNWENFRQEENNLKKKANE